MQEHPPPWGGIMQASSLEKIRPLLINEIPAGLDRGDMLKTLPYSADLFWLSQRIGLEFWTSDGVEHYLIDNKADAVSVFLWPFW
jgi:hypothetical protein